MVFEHYAVKPLDIHPLSGGMVSRCKLCSRCIRCSRCGQCSRCSRWRRCVAAVGAVAALQTLQSLQSLHSLQSLQSMQSLQSLQSQILNLGSQLSDLGPAKCAKRRNRNVNLPRLINIINHAALSWATVGVDGADCVVAAIVVS